MIHSHGSFGTIHHRHSSHVRHRTLRINDDTLNGPPKRHTRISCGLLWLFDVPQERILRYYNPELLES